MRRLARAGRIDIVAVWRDVLFGGDVTHLNKDIAVSVHQSRAHAHDHALRDRNAGQTNSKKGKKGKRAAITYELCTRLTRYQKS